MEIELDVVHAAANPICQRHRNALEKLITTW